MEIRRYNRLKVMSKRVQSEVCFNFVDREHVRAQFKILLAEKNKTKTWLFKKMGRNLGTISRWMTNKVQPSVEQLYEIAHHLDMDVKDLLVSSK